MELNISVKERVVATGVGGWVLRCMKLRLWKPFSFCAKWKALD